MGGIPVKEAEPAANDIVAEACEPAPLSRRQRLDVAPQYLDEHELCEAGQHGVGAGPPCPRFLDHLVCERLEPSVGEAAQVKSTRQRGQEGIERASIAA